MSERIDHGAEAHEYEKEACGAQRIGEESAEAMATLSLMKATLALVEQQRIANLLEMARHESENDSTPSDAIAVLWSQEDHGWHGMKLLTRPEIKEALGL